LFFSTFESDFRSYGKSFSLEIIKICPEYPKCLSVSIQVIPAIPPPTTIIGLVINGFSEEIRE